MLYFDDVSKLVSAMASELEYQYKSSPAGTNCYTFTIYGDSSSWQFKFDQDKQSFSFQPVHSTVTAYYTFNDFKLHFIENIKKTIFIKNAKIIADYFEVEVGINLIYDTCSVNGGVFCAVFRVLTKAKGTTALVKLTDGIYGVSVTSVDSGEQLFYRYKLNSGYVTPVPTFDSYMKNLLLENEGENRVKISQLNRESYILQYLGVSLLVTPKFEDSGVVLNVSFDNISVDLSGVNIYKSFDIYTAFMDEYNKVGLTEDTDEDTKEVVVTDSETSTNEQVDKSEDMSNTSVDEKTEERKEEQVQVESEKELEVQREETMSNSVENIDICVIKYAGNVKFVRFNSDGKLYDVSPQLIEDLGIPINRIACSEELFIKRGLYITASESASGAFAVDISDDRDLCKALVSRLFE